MTIDQRQNYPRALYFLSALLVILALRDYFSKYAWYSRFREAGIPAGAMWDFAVYPREALLYLSQHLLGFMAIAALLSLLFRSKHFPMAFLLYYVGYVTISIMKAVLYPGAHIAGAVVLQSALCVPWLLYVLRSSKVRRALGIPTEQSASITTP